VKGPGPCRTWSHFGDVQLDGLNWAAVARFEGNIADDLSPWGAEIPEKAKAEVEPLSGPTSVEGKLTQVHDPPGSEVGPGSVATYGTATTDEADAFGFRWQRSGLSSKHMRFDWSGPDA